MATAPIPFDPARYAREQLEAKQRALPEDHRLPVFRPLLDADDNPPRWLIEDFLLADEYQMLVGEGASFKTTVWLSILAAVAGGYHALGAFPTAEPRQVLLISGEDSDGVLKNRLTAIAKGHGWDLDRIHTHLHAICLEDVQISELRWQLWIEEQAAYFNAVLLGLDPMADLIDGDENDNSTARAVIRFFRRLGAAGTATLLCHHYGKASDQRQGVQRARGASAWLNAARAIYTTEQKDGSLWLGCGKMNRATRPPARELTVEIEHQLADPARGLKENKAVWTRATVALAHPPASSWMVQSRRELAPSERTALAAIDRHPDETLSWSRWMTVSGMSGSSLSLAIKRLVDLDYVRRNETGRRAGKPVFGYQVTVEGRNALLPSPRLHDSNATPISTPLESSTSTPRLQQPLIGGCIVEPVELPLASQIATEYGGPALESDYGPGLERDVPIGPEPDE